MKMKMEENEFSYAYICLLYVICYMLIICLYLSLPSLQCLTII